MNMQKYYFKVVEKEFKKFTKMELT